jgi:hypothetical protein
MIRYTLMSRLGLTEPLVRLARSIESSNRAASRRPAASAPRLRLDGRPGERPV